MGNPLATHTEASTKLITAHQAHHCDEHPRSQTGIIFDSRSSVTATTLGNWAYVKPLHESLELTRVDNSHCIHECALTQGA